MFLTNFYYINKTIKPYHSKIVSVEYPSYLFSNHCKEIAYRLSKVHNGMTKKLIYDLNEIQLKSGGSGNITIDTKRKDRKISVILSPTKFLSSTQ